MPRLSLWKENRGNDYKFFDRHISEMYTIGGTTMNIHKYLGTDSLPASNDSTTPIFDTVSEQNIQDLLFLENRDRKYEKDIYSLRGIYSVADIDFDLSQFGLFLQSDTIFITFHLNNMVETIGRKLISGDVLELPHLKDFFGLDESLPAALKRYYVVQEGSRASEGFSQTWWPHIWRVKATPLIDSQEYANILDQIQEGTDSSLRDILSTYQTELKINQAIIDQAEKDVPKSGYDISKFYIVPTNEDGSPADPGAQTMDGNAVTMDADIYTMDGIPVTPKSNGPYDNVTATYQSYLTGDGLAPNGFAVTPGITFPSEPVVGDYVLRLDYLPNRLFRWSGTCWVRIEDSVRTSLTPGEGNTQRDTFINNTNTNTIGNKTIIEKQALSQIFKPRADN